jgi:tRNA-dihydrouridine synthase
MALEARHKKENMKSKNSQKKTNEQNFWQKLAQNHKPFLALAPMEDVTDVVFRQIIADLGAPNVFFTEFTNTDGLFSEGRPVHMQRLEFTEDQRPIVAQIWGKNPETYFKAAKQVAEMGFDGVDINMGCPVKTVMKMGGGSALINNTEAVNDLLHATKEGITAADCTAKPALSVKTRLGIGKVVTEEWIGFLLAQNLDAITIHLRTAKRGSKDPAKWGEMTKIIKLRDKLAPETLIIGNGDVRSYSDALQKYEKYGMEGVMVGRGIFTNPWIFADKETGTDSSLDNHTKEEHIELLLKHAKMFEEKWGSTKDYSKMKKFFKVYVRGFEGASEMRTRLMLTRNYTDVENLLKNLS